MKYTAAFFKDTMPDWKRKKDSLIARYFHRPISFYFSSFFAEIGLTANQVSFISLIIAIIACVLFLFDNRFAHISGAVLINIWSITDSADGNMARSIGGKPYGDFIDATSSYVMVGFLLPILGWSTYRNGGWLFQQGDGLIILVGAIAGISDTMSRLFFQKMKCNTFEQKADGIASSENGVSEDSTIKRLYNRIESELGLGGWNMPAILICASLRSLDLYVVFYAFYYGVMFIVSTCYLIKKTNCLRN